MAATMTQQDSDKARGPKRTGTSSTRECPPVLDETDTIAIPRELRGQQVELEIARHELCTVQAALDKARENYADLYDNAPVGYITLDATGVIRDANLAAAALFRVERSALFGKPFSASLGRGQSIAFFNFIKQILAHDATEVLEVRLRGSGGVQRDVRLIGVARLDPDTGLRACRIALTDVREEKMHEETQRLHSLIMEHIAEGVVLVRAADGIILETNPAFERMFGYGADDLIGRHVSVLNAANTESQQDIAARIINSLQHLGKWEGEIHSIRQDGSRLWIQAAVTEFVHAAHGPVWVSVQRDITERKRTEQQVRERQDELAHVLRLNTVGELAATLAHELTQPVMAIEHFNHAAIGLAQSDHGAREELLQLLRCADQQVKRAGDVIRQLRKFMRRGVVDVKPVSVSRTIDEALLLLRPMIIDHSVAVRATCGVDVPLVNADPVQIEQVLVNLLRNSVEAMTTATGGPRCIDISCLRHAEKIEVIVQDNGPGLDPAREATLFDVLESGKVDGMGMGLAISRSIIQAHGGQLWAEPAAACGAVFHFTLPISNQSKDDGA